MTQPILHEHRTLALWLKTPALLLKPYPLTSILTKIHGGLPTPAVQCRQSSEGTEPPPLVTDEALLTVEEVALLVP